MSLVCSDGALLLFFSVTYCVASSDMLGSWDAIGEMSFLSRK